eukprot:14059667-Heterocapsa_arctica.AAC.1
MIIRLPGDAFEESLSEEPGEREGTELGRWLVQHFLVALKETGLWVSVVHRSSPLSPRGRGEKAQAAGPV